ncbi:MAG: hypothetical protein ACI31S_04695 [Bacilli bacterium]
MESRMEKYYKEDLSTFERSKKNEKLYKEISKEISDYDNLPIPDNSNEIDMNGLKKIISSRDEYRKAKEIDRTFINEQSFIEKEEEKENKIYDINILLENAKSEINRSNDIMREKKIGTNFLTDLEDANIPNNDDAVELSSEIIEHKDDIKNSSSNTDSLPLDILADLKGNDNTIVTDPIVKDEVTMIKKIKDGETFYSGSYSFSKKDFFNEEDDEPFIEEKRHTGIKVFFIIIGLLLIAAITYLIITKYIL